jgi:hypothetical protein
MLGCRVAEVRTRVSGTRTARTRARVRRAPLSAAWLLASHRFQTRAEAATGRVASTHALCQAKQSCIAAVARRPTSSHSAAMSASSWREGEPSSYSEPHSLVHSANASSFHTANDDAHTTVGCSTSLPARRTARAGRQAAGYVWRLWVLRAPVVLLACGPAPKHPGVALAMPLAGDGFAAHPGMNE